MDEPIGWTERREGMAANENSLLTSQREKGCSVVRITKAHEVAQGGSYFPKKRDLTKMASAAHSKASSPVGTGKKKKKRDAHVYLRLSASRRPDSVMSDQVELPSGFLCGNDWV